VLKDRQTIISFCHNSRVWQTDRQTDEQLTTARPCVCVRSRTVKTLKHCTCFLMNVVYEVFMHYFQNMSSPTGAPPLNPACRTPNLPTPGKNPVGAHENEPPFLFWECICLFLRKKSFTVSQFSALNHLSLMLMLACTFYDHLQCDRYRHRMLT